MTIGAYGTEVLERIERVLLPNVRQWCQVMDMNEANSDLAICLLKVKTTHATV